MSDINDVLAFSAPFDWRFSVPSFEGIDELERLRKELMEARAQVIRKDMEIASLIADCYLVNDRQIALEEVALCAMRYVKAQSATYQRELLAAIDELEKHPGDE